jgi:hypothetical protein
MNNNFACVLLIFHVMPCNQESGCGSQVCRASIWHLTDPRLSYPTPRELLPEDEEALLTSAKEFLEQYYSSIKR